VLHDEQGRIVRRYNGRRWIACRLQFRGRSRRPLMEPGRYTQLFFLDEATAFAAGHRPCAECRHEDFAAFISLWGGGPGADDIDAQLHGERIDPVTRRQRRHEAPIAELPDGAFVLHEGLPHLVLGQELLRWSAGGYTDRAGRPPSGVAVLLTPPSLVEVLRAGWRSSLDLVYRRPR
jgi:hypothetical protein